MGSGDAGEWEQDPHATIDGPVAGGSVRFDLHASDTIAVALDDEEGVLRGIERQTVGKCEWTGMKHRRPSVGADSVDQAVVMLELTGITHIEIALGIEDTEVGCLKRALPGPLGEPAHAAGRIDPQHRVQLVIADEEVPLPVERDAQAETTGAGDVLGLASVGRDAVDLSKLPAGIDRPVGSDRHPLWVVEIIAKRTDFLDGISPRAGMCLLGERPCLFHGTCRRSSQSAGGLACMDS